MTDNDIIKALECCGVDEDMCLDCPIQCDCEKDTEAMIDRAKAILDLINRQKAEVERLRGQCTRLKQYDEERDIRLHARLTANARAEGYQVGAKEVMNKLIIMLAEQEKIFEESASKLVSSDYASGRSEVVKFVLRSIGELKVKFAKEGVE